MTARQLARSVAAGRVGFGVALIAAPRLLGRAWVGRDGGREGAGVITRGLGARDLALGAGTLASAQDDLRTWVAMSLIADAADLLATLAAGDRVPKRGRVIAAITALGGVAAGLAALAGLSRPGADVSS